MLRFRRVLLMATLAAFGSILPGCGPSYPDTVPVAGSVTLDGKPVAGAAVVFTPEDGHRATGTTDASGRFELSSFRLADGAVPGKHRVTVAKTTVKSGEEEKVLFIVPQKYGNLATTELTCDVQEEMGPVQFDLQRDPDPALEEDSPPADATDSLESEEPSP